MHGIKNPVITERTWCVVREITAEQLSKDLAYAKDINFSVNEWRGESRDGEPMTIVWVAGARAGNLLSAYEIVERFYPVGTRVVCDVPDFGPWYGRVVVCLCKRHTYQPEIGGRECGCSGIPAACPRPMHVRWDNGNESHEGQYVRSANA